MIYRAVSIGCDKRDCDAMFDGYAGMTQTQVREAARQMGWSTGIGERGVAGQVTDYCPEHGGKP
jgi:hypothetical protein